VGKEAVYRLLTDAEGDEALRRELEEALEGEGDRADALLAFASRRGYEFTAEQFTQVFAAATRQEGELSDEELEGVAGGVGLSVSPGALPILGTANFDWASQANSALLQSVLSTAHQQRMDIIRGMR
jgi:predicted ribosomally synthesized peptide with nif11-like leader